MIRCLITFLLLSCIILTFKAENTSQFFGTACINNVGEPKFCYPPYDNFASAGIKVIATNTCGLRKRQKYCVGLSTAEMRSRCEYCDNSNSSERHSADFLTDQNQNSWWQSETLADNKDAFKQQSINLTLNMGNRFHVTFLYMKFKSPRPSAMVIYRKYDNNSPWQPWQYFASNCLQQFNMTNNDNEIIQRFDDVLCTERFSSLNEFYDGVVMFTTVHGRPGSDNFYHNNEIMKWTTASKIRIELKRMHTFGEQNNEEELLLTYYYAIKDIQIGARCWCNGHGDECRKSTGTGQEPQLYCVCHSSHHTIGQSCEKCDSFYQDRPWQPATVIKANICQRCNCNDNSQSCIFDEELYIKSGNISGGLCLNCRGNTKGAHCNECLEGFYQNPEQPNRCIPCNCDPIGRENIQCDQEGKCLCQTGVEGDKCTRCKGDHFNFGSRGCQPCNCYLPGVNVTDRLLCNPSTGTCYCKKNVIGEKCDNCVGGFFALTESDPLGCRPCFCFAHTKECNSANGYFLAEIYSQFDKKGSDIEIFDSLDGWKYGIGSKAPEFNPMLDVSSKYSFITWYIDREPWRDDYFLSAPKKFLGNRRLSYNLNLMLTISFEFRPEYRPLTHKLTSMINDVQLISDTLSVSVPFDIGSNKFPEVGNNPNVYVFRLNEESGLWRDRLDYFRFQSILSNLDAIKIRLTNPYGYVKLHKVVMETAVDYSVHKLFNTSLPETKSVEKCNCPIQYTGLSCENCASGFHREYSVGTEFVKCVKCNCNNQSDICDSRTGVCDCQHNTVGENCEKCVNGFYGDPTLQIPNICQPCGCPGGTSCDQVGDKVVCTDCPDNLGGYRCDRCRDGFYGNPKLNISCQPCQCHGNIDYFSSCNSVTGKCPNCIYNSAGNQCETCKPGFYLLPNERAPNRCKRCICNPYGIVPDGHVCDINTGQCSCKPLLIGQKCDVCKPGYFNLTSVNACQSCNCFSLGSSDETCDKDSGQCNCKPGVTGLRCDRCEFGYFNLSNTGCQRCLCDSEGSETLQCDMKTGQCVCKTNVIGWKCDQCLENHYNLTNEGCQTCPPCYGLIQKKVDILKIDLSNLILSINSMNISDDNSFNVSSILNTANQLNNTLNDLINKYMNNTEKINDIDGELRKANVLLKDIEDGITNYKNSKSDENMNNIVNDIRNTKIAINNLLEINFPERLAHLKSHIKYKNANNEKITKLAKTADLYQIRANAQKENISKIVLEAEQNMNDSLNNFVNLIGKYNTFKMDSSKFDTIELTNLSNKIQTESLNNLLKIYEANSTLNGVERRISEDNSKLNNLLNISNALIIGLLDSERNLNQLEKQFKIMVTSLPNLKSLEEQINSKTNSFSFDNQSFIEARQMSDRLNEAQKNLTNAINKANKTLIKLQDLYKDFNDVVNKSKFEAEEQIKRLPQLKVKLDEIKSEIKTLNESTIDTITKMTLLYNDMLTIHNQSNQIWNNSQILNIQMENLLNQTEIEMKSVETIENLSNNKNREYLIIEEQLLILSTELQKTVAENSLQTSSLTQLESGIDNIMKQLSDIKNKSKLANDMKFERYSKEIKKLSETIENYFNKELNIIFQNIENLTQDHDELKMELELTNKEIERLKLIDEHMVVTGHVCYKSGGKVEGYL